MSKDIYKIATAVEKISRQDKSLIFVVYGGASYVMRVRVGWSGDAYLRIVKKYLRRKRNGKTKNDNNSFDGKRRNLEGNKRNFKGLCGSARKRGISKGHKKSRSGIKGAVKTKGQRRIVNG